MNEKHFAFIYNNPIKGECLLWPGWYEDNKERIDKDYEEITEYDLKNVLWNSTFNNTPRKVFIKKQKQSK